MRLRTLEFEFSIIQVMRFLVSILILGLGLEGSVLACKPDMLSATNNLAARALNLARKPIQNISAVEVQNLKTEHRKTDKKFSCPDTYTADFTFSLKEGCVVKVRATMSPTESELGQILSSTCDR